MNMHSGSCVSSLLIVTTISLSSPLLFLPSHALYLPRKRPYLRCKGMKLDKSKNHWLLKPLFPNDAETPRSIAGRCCKAMSWGSRKDESKGCGPLHPCCILEAPCCIPSASCIHQWLTASCTFTSKR